MRAGLIDPTVPVVPAIEITFGVPVQLSPALFRPPPCAKSMEFLDHLVQEGSIAGDLFSGRWNAKAPMTGPTGDDLGDLHAAVNAAGKLLFTALSHALGHEELPQYRFLLNRVENAWLDFNAHSPRVSPSTELRQAKALQDDVAAFTTALADLSPTTPDWASPDFAHTCKTMLLGARLTRKEEPLSFQFAGIPVPVTFEVGSSPRVPCEAACTVVTQLCGTTIHLLETLGISDTMPDDHRTLRGAIRAKFPPRSTEFPQLYIAHHYQVKSTNKRQVPLEEGREEETIVDRTLQPGEDLFVAIKSWECDTTNIEQIAAYPDTPLPEARDDLVRRLQFACQETAQAPGLSGRTLLVTKDLVGGIPQLLKESILAQVRKANAHRTYVVKDIPEGKRDRCQTGGQPTNPKKINALKFQNVGKIPLRVWYIPAQKTYTITVSFAKAGLLCFDGASWKEAGREKWPRALSALLKPTTSIDDTPIPAAMRDAEMQGKAKDSTLIFDVVLRKPVAAPVGFIMTYVKEFVRGTNLDKAKTRAGKGARKEEAPQQ